ncbi:serine/threonine-protein kinase SBK1-like [Liolophura sinensis]|uniref:serine/threonine-protein kinase SBK1-like n=1 Tax=Liolophura sinensis TaxID=3198878 RepID=UPI003158B29D
MLNHSPETMTSVAPAGSINRDESLQLLNLKEHYEIIKELGRGTYGKVVQAKCRHTGAKIALKILPKSNTKIKEFQREFNYSYFLSPHANIVDTYNVAFETRSSYVFAQEFVPLGDLFEAIPPQVGLTENQAKNCIKQVASALEFMHSKYLVHRDIKPENILVFDNDLTKIKLMDFGMTRKEGTVIRKMSGSIPYTPPEICEAVRNESITVSMSGDVWAFGVLLFCMLTGNFPWEHADIRDVYFNEFSGWQRRKTTKIPSQWRKFTPRLMRYFRKVLDGKADRRCAVKEIQKYINDCWVVQSKDNHQSEEEGSDSGSDHMEQLTTILAEHGISTQVDKRLRERRISEWLLSF